MNRVLAALVAALLTVVLGAVTANPAEAALPTQQQWVSDTYQAHYGSRYFLHQRVVQQQAADARNGTTVRLAVNLDIDNTSLASHYAPGKPVLATLRFVRYAKGLGVTVLFNTGRLQSVTGQAAAQLRKAGYPVDGICGRQQDEGLAHSKQRCRRKFAAAGYTIVTNVGNRATDFTGTGYERAVRLPNYANQLS